MPEHRMHREEGPGMPPERARQLQPERHLTIVRDERDEQDGDLVARPEDLAVLEEIEELERQAEAGALGPAAQAEMALLRYTRSASGQIAKAEEYQRLIESDRAVRVPWAALDAMIGPLVPGWIVFFGARPKAGKTTTLLNLLEAWSSLRRRCLYLTTETGPEALRQKWACMHAGVTMNAYLKGEVTPEEAAAVARHRHRQMTDPVLLNYALFEAAQHMAAPALVEACVRAKRAGVEVVIYDYLQRVRGLPGQHDVSRVADATKQLKDAARELDLLVVSAATLWMGKGLLDEYEPPGNGSWYYGQAPQQEADVAVQMWKPFRSGIGREEKRLVLEGHKPVEEIVQPATMGLRLAAHRWWDESNNRMARLRIEGGWLSDLPTWGMPR